MDKETRPEARQAEKSAAKSFVKPAIAVSAFTVGLIYVLFCFDSLMHVGGVLMNALSSLIAGLFIAYILNVFLNLFENFIFGRLTRGTNRLWHRIRRPLCVALSFAVVILILLAIVLYIVPEIFQSLELIGETARVNIPIYVQNVTKWLDQLSVELNLNLENSLDFLKDFNWTSILTGATEFTSSLVSSLVNATVNVASGIFTFILAIIFSVYFLMGKESLLLSLKRVVYSEKGRRNARRHRRHREQRLFVLCARPAHRMHHPRLPVLHRHVADRLRLRAADLLHHHAFGADPDSRRLYRLRDRRFPAAARQPDGRDLVRRLHHLPAAV